MALKFAVNNSLSAVTSLPTAIPTGSMTLLQTQTASSSSSIDFTSNIDSTYDSYVFKFIDIHPATDNVQFQFNMSTDGGSNYNVTKTTTFFNSYHDEADTSTGVSYNSGADLAQSTGFQQLGRTLSNGADECGAGILQIFNPSSTTYVKHFISRFQEYADGSYSIERYIAGYGNTTSAVNSIKFQMSSGNIDSGVIKLYGIS
jgi:hypothetical protein